MRFNQSQSSFYGKISNHREQNVRALHRRIIGSVLNNQPKRSFGVWLNARFPSVELSLTFTTVAAWVLGFPAYRV